MSEEINFELTSTDKTGKGVSSAEKRLGQLGKKAGKAERDAASETERRVGRSSRGVLRAFTGVERAGGRLLGSGSVISGLAGRLGAIGEAGSAVGGALGEAATAGSALTGVLGAVGVAVGATAGALVAGAFAAFKLADGWVKGAAAIGRTAEMLGVSTRALGAFEAAAQRAGLDQGQGTATLGSLAQTLDDARYGRNPQALEVLRRLGVQLKLRKDGTVDTEAMLPAIADAIARQNSSGRRTAARALGIDPNALAVFTQGGEALKADMKDAEQTAVSLSPEDVKLARQLRRRHVIAGQVVERQVVDRAGRALATGLDSVENYAVEQFSGSVTRDFKPAAESNRRSAERMERAAGRIESASQALSFGGGSGLRNGQLNLTTKDVLDLKKVAATEWDKRSVPQLHGIVDTLLNRLASGHWGTTMRSVADAKSQFSNVNGPVAWRQGRHSVDQLPASIVSARLSAMIDSYLTRRASGAPSVVGDNLSYANPNYSDRRNREGWIRELDGPTLGEGSSIHRHGTPRGLRQYRPGDFTVAAPTEHQHRHEIIIEDRRTTVRSSTDGGAPSVSNAFPAYIPVHGG